MQSKKEKKTKQKFHKYNIANKNGIIGLREKKKIFTFVESNKLKYKRFVFFNWQNNLKLTALKTV